MLLCSESVDLPTEPALIPSNSLNYIYVPVDHHRDLNRCTVIICFDLMLTLVYLATAPTPCLLVRLRAAQKISKVRRLGRILRLI